MAGGRRSSTRPKGRSRARRTWPQSDSPFPSLHLAKLLRVARRTRRPSASRLPERCHPGRPELGRRLGLPHRDAEGPQRGEAEGHRRGRGARERAPVNAKVRGAVHRAPGLLRRGREDAPTRRSPSRRRRRERACRSDALALLCLSALLEQSREARDEVVKLLAAGDEALMQSGRAAFAHNILRGAVPVTAATWGRSRRCS